MSVGDSSVDSSGEGEPDVEMHEPDEATDAAPIEQSKSLEEAIRKIGLAISDEAIKSLSQYCELLWDWNEKINLTRHTNFDLFAKRDLVDSWHLAQLLEPGEDILDVGSGGGVPGIPLAILRPDIQVSLCDSVGKKAKVLDQMVQKLKLPVPVHAMRVQEVLRDYRYSTLVARAVGPLDKLCEWLKNDWHNFDRLLALKGPKWIEERGAARHRGLLKGLSLRRLDSYPMAGTESESVILQLRRIRPGEKINPAEDEA